MFGCGTSTIGDVIRESGKWLAINEDDHAAQLRKNRQPKWPALEQAMTIWLERLFLANQDIYSPDTNEEVEILKSISYSDAHSAIQTTLMFLEQNRNDNIKVDIDDLLLLRRLLRDIEKEKIKIIITSEFIV